MPWLKGMPADRNEPPASQADPLTAVAAFLAGIADEAQRRGYHFNAAKISRRRFKGQIPETNGQLLYEWRHLQAKLRARAPVSRCHDPGAASAVSDRSGQSERLGADTVNGAMTSASE